MVQQTRKDPRAKVLSMTVRYKSATLDEFIEHHSHDVSRGGMFIKTPQPFPPGTLLKFEVRIAEDRKVMQGVGRVVWKRDNAVADVERPSGMGVKFIKLDDESRLLIEQLLTNRQEDDSAFDAEKAADVDAEAPVGLGLSQFSVPDSSGVEHASSFFPKTDNAPMPAPEDRTVMKQASELLEEALREVGSDTSESKVAKASSLLAEIAEITDEDTKPGRPSRSSDPLENLTNPKPSDSGKPTDPQLKAKHVSEAVSASRFVAAAKAASIPSPERKSSTPKPNAPLSTKPALPKILATERKSTASVPTTSQTPKPSTPLPDSKKAASGRGRGVFWLLAVAASVGVVYWVTRPSPVPAPAADPVTAETLPAAAPTTESATTPAPTAVPIEPVPIDAAIPSASALPSAAVPPLESAQPPVVTAALPAVPPPAAVPPAVKAVNVKPKAVKPAAPANSVQPEAQPSPTGTESGTPTASAPAPAAPAPAAPAPAAPEPPAPTPKPKAEKSDNPY